MNERFPATRYSALAATRSNVEAERTRAYGQIVEAYWKPTYKYIRVKWGKSSEDAKDMTQGFFTRVMEKEFFHGYDPVKAKFRTFLRVCLDRYIANEEKAASRIKRGGDVQVQSLDFQVAEEEMRRGDPPTADSVERLFDNEWVRALFGAALEEFRQASVASGKEVQFDLFSRYHLAADGESPGFTYQQIALEMNIPVTTITNHLAYGRREFRRIVLEKLREITATEEEFREEARSLLGVHA